MKFTEDEKRYLDKLRRNYPKRDIQKILGHSSSKTTEIYTHVSNQILSKVNLPI